MLSTKAPVSVKGLTQPVYVLLIFWRDRCFGTPCSRGIKISKFNTALVLVFTKSLVNLNSLALMVCSLLTFL